MSQGLSPDSTTVAEVAQLCRARLDRNLGDSVTLRAGDLDSQHSTQLTGAALAMLADNGDETGHGLDVSRWTSSSKVTRWLIKDAEGFYCE